MQQGAELIRPRTAIHGPEEWERNKRTMWSLVYSPFGLAYELGDFISLRPWVEGDGEDGRWCAPVIKGLAIDPLVEAFKGLKISVCFLGSMKSAIHDRDPENGSYWAGIHRTDQADPDLKNVSVKSLDERGVKGCTNFEYLLFNFASCLGNGGIPLDSKGTSTVCSGSRRGKFVSVASYCETDRTIYFRPMLTMRAHDSLRVREVFLPD